MSYALPLIEETKPRLPGYLRSGIPLTAVAALWDRLRMATSTAHHCITLFAVINPKSPCGYFARVRMSTELTMNGKRHCFTQSCSLETGGKGETWSHCCWKWGQR